jgi:hypothetical protein
MKRCAFTMSKSDAYEDGNWRRLSSEYSVHGYNENHNSFHNHEKSALASLSGGGLLLAHFPLHDQPLGLLYFES